MATEGVPTSVCIPLHDLQAGTSLIRRPLDTGPGHTGRGRVLSNDDRPPRCGNGGATPQESRRAGHAPRLCENVPSRADTPLKGGAQDGTTTQHPPSAVAGTVDVPQNPPRRGVEP